MSKFISLKFSGDTFLGHTLPIKFLKDVQIYAELIQKLAIHLRKKNLGRSRVDSEFRSAINLELKASRPGSYVEDLVRSLPAEYSETVAEADELSLARDMVNAIFRTGTLAAIPTDFPDELRGSFAKLGMNLKEGESILFDNTGEFELPDNVIAFTPHVRRNLTNNNKNYDDACAFKGILDGFTVSTSRVSILDISKTFVVSGIVPKQLKEFLRDIHRKSEYHEVKLYGIAEYYSDGIPKQFRKIQHLIIYGNETITMIPEIEDQIKDIQALPENWDQGYGRSFTEAELNYCRDLVLEICKEENELPSPYIFPSSDGFLTLQWEIGFWNITCNIVSGAASFEAHAYNSATDVEEIGTISEANAANDVIEFLKKFIPRASNESN